MDGVYVEISMNPNDQYGLWTIVFLIRLTEESVNNHLREFNFPQKNTNELGPAWHIVGNHRIRGQKKIAFSYSDPGGTLEKKLNDLKPLSSRKKSLTFRKRSKKTLLHWRANLADQNKQQPLKINIRVTHHTILSVWNKPLIHTCQHFSASRANQALRSLANAGFQNRGVCLQAFPSFPSPSPHFHFFGSCFITRAAKTENPVPRSFFAAKPNGNACYAGYESLAMSLPEIYLRVPNRSFGTWDLLPFLLAHLVSSVLG